MQSQIVTIDLYVTSEGIKECPYCRRSQDNKDLVKTKIARRIIERIREAADRRIVFTGSDPIRWTYTGRLVYNTKQTCIGSS